MVRTQQEDGPSESDVEMGVLLILELVKERWQGIVVLEYERTNVSHPLTACACPSTFESKINCVKSAALSPTRPGHLLQARAGAP